MIARALKLFILMVFVSCICAENTASAQSAPSLGDLLNPKQEEKAQLSTLSDYANDFYVRCLAEDSLTFDTFQKRLLCGCSSAKLQQIFSIENFQKLYIKSIASRTERSNYVAHAYAPCLIETLGTKAKNYCYKQPGTKGLPRSLQDEACQCVADKTEARFTSLGGAIITRAMTDNPYSLNPADQEIARHTVSYTLPQNFKSCYYKAKYDYDNAQ